jgi:para-nitrobenzyl esterase
VLLYAEYALYRAGRKKDTRQLIGAEIYEDKKTREKNRAAGVTTFSLAFQDGSHELVTVKDTSPEYSATTRLFDQIVFIAPLFRMSENVTRAGGKNYTYFFTPESTVRLTRSVHAVELPGVFNHPELTESTGRAFDETFSKIMRKMWVQFATCGNPTLQADVSPDGKEHVWPLYDLEDRQAMVFDEFDIHPEKEDVRQILDWDRTYFLTRYYCI